MRLFSLLLLAALLPAAASAQPALPARIGGTVTLDGQRVTAGDGATWEFSATRADGRTISPAIASTGLTPASGYALDVPLFDATTQPGGVAPGTALLLAVRRNGVALALAQPAGGSVTVGQPGSLTTANLALTTASGRLVNLATRAQLAAGGNLLPGFVLAGTGEKSLLIRAVGPGLAQFGLTNGVAAPILRLFGADQRQLATNTGWATASNAAAMAAAATRLGGFPLPAGSADSAILVTLGPGPYTAQVTPATTGGLALVEVYDADTTPGTLRLVNLSTRALVGAGGNILIPGLVTAGGERQLLIRAIGPTLGQFGVTGTLADPQLDVLRGETVLASNDNWGTAANATDITATAARVGAFVLPAGSRDAAVLVTVAPGPYTVQVRGVGGTTGEALVEVYEVR